VNSAFGGRAKIKECLKVMILKGGDKEINIAGIIHEENLSVQNYSTNDDY